MRGLPVRVAGLGIVGLLLQPIHFYVESGVRDRGLVLLRQVELALLLKTRARVALAEGPVLGPFLGELLGETALRRNGPGPSGLVLRAGRRWRALAQPSLPDQEAMQLVHDMWCHPGNDKMEQIYKAKRGRGFPRGFITQLRKFHCATCAV